MPQPYPVTPTSSTADSRLRIAVAPTAAAKINSPTITCNGEPHSANSGRLRAPSASTTTGTTASVERMTACVAGIEPRCVVPVSRTESTSAPRITAS